MITELLDRLMRNGQRLSLEQLQHEASEAVYKARKKRIEVARELKVSSGSISSALNNVGTRWAAMQIRIIEAYTDYKLTPDPGYLVKRKQEEK